MRKRESLQSVERLLTDADPAVILVGADIDAILREANAQGVEELVSARLLDVGLLPASHVALARRREALSALWFDQVRLGALKALECLSKAGIPAIPLKGPLLAERLYKVPAHRSSSDIDVLVMPADLARATEALTSLGYTPDGGANPHLRETAHHIHLLHPVLPMLELHFHAHDGFGEPVRADRLFKRAIEADIEGVRHLRLDPDDELAYLAIHAAGHRFTRLLWLVDLKLAIEHGAQVQRARDAATTLGGRRAFDLAMLLLDEQLDIDAGVIEGRARLDMVRRILDLTHIDETHPLSSSALTFAVSLALCDRPRAMGAYVATKVMRDIPLRIRAIRASRA